MAQPVYNIIKAPVGWSVFCDRVRIGGVYGTKGAALEAIAVAAAFTVLVGNGVQINVPGGVEPGEIEIAETWPSKWSALLK